MVRRESVGDSVQRKAELIELFAQRAEPGVRNAIIERYLPLAESLARRYAHSGQPLDDLIQVASLGLVRSVDRFDAQRGVSFESFAFPTILGELKRHHRDLGWSVRLPRRLKERTLLIKNAIPLLSQDLGRSPTVHEIAEYAGLTSDEVLEAIDAQDAYSSTSIDIAFESESSTLRDRIASRSGEYEIADEWAEFLPHLRALPERERVILMYRFFRDWTQGQIAEELDISQMHVSRLLARTLRKLREAVAAERVLTPAV
jgi:RNA polymerase sigma-B factor